MDEKIKTAAVSIENLTSQSAMLAARSNLPEDQRKHIASQFQGVVDIAASIRVELSVHHEQLEQPL